MWNKWTLNLEPNYARRIWEQRFHSEIAPNVFFLLKAAKSHDNRDVIVFRPHYNVKLVGSSSLGLKGVFEKLRFHDGLVWTVGLTVEIKLCFQIPPT